MYTKEQVIAFGEAVLEAEIKRQTSNGPVPARIPVPVLFEEFSSVGNADAILSEGPLGEELTGQPETESATTEQL